MTTVDRVDQIAVGSILKAGGYMGRDRYGEGSLVLVGKRIKKWRGHFYVYQTRPDGSEVRRFRNILLGLKVQMDKGEAKIELREIIARETKGVAPAPVDVTSALVLRKSVLTPKRRAVEGHIKTEKRSASSKTTCSNDLATSDCLI